MNYKHIKSKLNYTHIFTINLQFLINYSKELYLEYNTYFIDFNYDLFFSHPLNFNLINTSSIRFQFNINTKPELKFNFNNEITNNYTLNSILIENIYRSENKIYNNYFIKHMEFFKYTTRHKTNLYFNIESKKLNKSNGFFINVNINNISNLKILSNKDDSIIDYSNYLIKIYGKNINDKLTFFKFNLNDELINLNLIDYLKIYIELKNSLYDSDVNLIIENIKNIEYIAGVIL